MANYMKEVAKLLGVELEEEFNLKGIVTKGDYGKYKLTEDGLWTSVTLQNSETWDESNNLVNVLNGSLEVVKLPFKPKKEEKYWTYVHGDFSVASTVWLETAMDYAKFKSGMLFRTQAEALRERPRIYEELTGKRWDEEE